MKIEVKVGRDIKFDTARAIADAIAFGEFKVHILGWKDDVEQDYFMHREVSDESLLEIVVNDKYHFYYEILWEVKNMAKSFENPEKVHIHRELFPEKKNKELVFETKTLDPGVMYVNRKDKLGILRVDGDVFVMPVVFDNRRVRYEGKSP